MIYNNENLTNAQAIEQIREAISPLVPHFSIHKGNFGNEHILMCIMFDKKETWANGIMENSNYVRISVDEKGEIVCFTRSLYERGKNYSYETRLPLKFRKCTVINLNKGIRKIIEFVNKVKESLGD
jgi:hypothetical protein